MSGGHFDYAQFQIDEVADEIERLIKSNNDSSLNGWGETVGRFYSPVTIEAFKTALLFCRLAAAHTRRVDWLVSGDDSEKSFLEQIDEEIDRVHKSWSEFVESLDDN